MDKVWGYYDKELNDISYAHNDDLIPENLIEVIDDIPVYCVFYKRYMEYKVIRLYYDTTPATLIGTEKQYSQRQLKKLLKAPQAKGKKMREEALRIREEVIKKELAEINKKNFETVILPYIMQSQIQGNTIMVNGGSKGVSYAVNKETLDNKTSILRRILWWHPYAQKDEVKAEAIIDQWLLSIGKYLPDNYVKTDRRNEWDYAYVRF